MGKGGGNLSLFLSCHHFHFLGLIFLGGGERWREFILSGRDCARPRYHSSVAKLLLSTFLIMKFKKRTKSTQNVNLLLFVILFIFVKLSFLSPPFLKFPFPSKIENNDSDSLSYSLLSLHLMKMRQIEKWIKGPEISV